MKIVIDISPISYGTGVSYYVKELITALSHIDRENHYLLFAGVLQQADHLTHIINKLQLPDNFKLKTMPIPPRIQAKLWNDWHLLKLETLIGPFDLYHSLDWSLAPSSYPRVITVHDLFFLKHPELQLHPYKDTLKRRLIRAKDQQLPAIAVSQATKSDLVELLGYPEELVTVIYEAPPHKPSSKKITPLHKLQLKYRLPKQYLLMVSTREPRKNLDRTIQAFSQIKTDFHLVVVGKAGWEETNQNTLPNVHFTGYVPEQDLAGFYTHAYAFLYPSLYEGFGQPILQAFQYQLPVLTSNLSSMPEVAGKAAMYVDPYDLNSLVEGLQQLINLSHQQRQSLITQGNQQLKNFSWQQTAIQTLDLYKKTGKL